MNSDKERPFAYIKHQLPGRVRLKIPQKKKDSGYFERIAEFLTGFPGITQLQLNPAAASILICHAPGTEFGAIGEFAEANGLFNLTEAPEQEIIVIPQVPIATLTSTTLNDIDELLKEFSQGLLDNRSLLLLTLIGLALHQTAKGNVMVPAVSLLWSAIELLREESVSAD
ncbi:MAG: HMA2 domain-containing protein [Methylobacter sp.]